jgi:outer membrane protein insertion porin family
MLGKDTGRERVLFEWVEERRASAHIRRTIGVLAAVWLAIVPMAWSQGDGFEGQRITQIRIRGQQEQTLSDKLPPMPLEVGKPFDIDAERESLRQLYRTGRYSDIRVEVTPELDGLRVDFVVRRNYYNNVVSIEGLKEPPNEAAALASMRMGLGEPFRESALKEGLGHLVDTLRDEGLYQAKVDYTLVPHEDTRSMDINVHVDSGARARVGSIDLLNHTGLPDKTLLNKSKLSPGKEVTSARLDRAANRVKKFLVSEGHLGANAYLRPGSYDPKTNKVSLAFDVTSGPRVRVEVSGAKFSQAKLRKLIPIYAEGTVDEDLLQEGRRNLRDSLERDGYFDADVQVSSTMNTEKGERVITYEVSRGGRHKLVGVTFKGNRYFSSDLLESRLQLQTASFASRGRFSQSLVRSDAVSIRDLYLANGFNEAKATPEVADNYGKKVGDIFVTFQIDEGPQTRVSELSLEGNHALNNDVLLGVIGSTPGQPYSAVTVSSDRNNILALYFNDGFPEARFDSQVKQTSESNRVQLTYRVTEGRQIEVSQVLLTGYEHTRRGVISRQVQIKPDGPLREGDVVESQRRLYNLGVFNRVQIAPQNPDGSDPDKTVVVQVNEGKRYTVGYGFGFEALRLPGSTTNPAGTTLSASPRGLFEISKSNFAGRAQTISFKARASTFQYRGVLSFLAPNLFTNPKWTLQLTGFADKTLDVNTFTSSRYEGSFQLEQTVSPGTSLYYRYFFRHVIVQAGSLHVTPDQIPLFSQPTKISGFGLSWVRDRRNNPADASRGIFNSADFTIAPQSIGSTTNFVRIFLQNSTFHPFGRAFVFARSTRFGVEQTFSGSAQNQIPLPERFFAGGATSLRGFSLNQAGPRDRTTGFPVGGLALLVFNQELRFPMKLPYVGNRIGGTAFYDFGNVYTDVSQITFRTSPSSLTDDLNYLSHTIGFGLRYATPIGPVRVDFGYQLNPAQFQFSFINSATKLTETKTQRLPHFQFFFNIGPVF